MSKTLYPAMEALLATGAASLAMLMKITRPDTVVTRLTDYDRPITYGGNTYSPEAGLKRSALSVSEGLAVDSMTVAGYFFGDLTEEALRKGKYDAAEVEVIFVEASDPDTYGPIPMFDGFVGDTGFHRNTFSLSVNGFTELLQQNFGEATSPDCRADLGDARCKLSMAAYTHTGTITAITDEFTYSVSVSKPAGYFKYGSCEFTSGDNSGTLIEVKESTDGTITLFMPPQYTVAVGNAITLKAGCNKSEAACSGTFFNIINFQGEPHLPGITPMTENAARLI